MKFLILNQLNFGKTIIYLKKSITRSKKLGHIGIQNIAINTIVPLLFLYGKITHQERYSLKATMLLEELEAEENKIVKNIIYMV